MGIGKYVYYSQNSLIKGLIGYTLYFHFDGIAKPLI